MYMQKRRVYIRKKDQCKAKTNLVSASLFSCTKETCIHTQKRPICKCKRDVCKYLVSASQFQSQRVTTLHLHSACPVCVIWSIHMCDVTHSYTWHGSFIYSQRATFFCLSPCPVCVTWLIHMCDVTHSYVWRDSFICMTWLIHIQPTSDISLSVSMSRLCYMIHSYVWRDPFHMSRDPITHVTCLVHMWDMTHPYTVDSPSAFTMCDMIHSYMWRDSFICVTWPIQMWRDSITHVTCHIRMWDMTHSYTADEW